MADAEEKLRPLEVASLWGQGCSGSPLLKSFSLKLEVDPEVWTQNISLCPGAETVLPFISGQGNLMPPELVIRRAGVLGNQAILRSLDVLAVCCWAKSLQHLLGPPNLPLGLLPK